MSLYDSEGSLLYESYKTAELYVEWDRETLEEVRKQDVMGFIDWENPPGSKPRLPLRGGVFYRVGVRAVNAAGVSAEVLVESSPCTDCAPPPPTTTTIPVVEVVHEGGFESVTAGWAYSCGLRVDRSVECWEWMADMSSYPDEGSGSGWSEDASNLTPPGGEFTMVNAGWEYACGLRPTGEVECWGRNPAAAVEPPDGEFTAVSVGVEHACALRPDNEIKCWGWAGKDFNKEPFVLSPERPFTDIAAGEAGPGSYTSFLCGLRPSGEVECWGGKFDLCWFLPSGELECWERTWLEESSKTPEGVFESIDGDGRRVCGIRPSREVECWSDSPSDDDPHSPPSGEFSMVSAGQGSYSCGLRPTGEIECWNNTPGGRAAHAPEGKFTWVNIVSRAACGLPVDGGVVCWNVEDAERSPWRLSEGEFKSLSSSRWSHRCGVRVDGEVECWSRNQDNEFGEASPPGGKFESVSVNNYYSCGLRPSGEVECWGSNELGQSTPPAGVFTQIMTAEDYACGLRPSGELKCWGGGEFEWLLSKMTPPEERLVSVDAGWGGHVERDSLHFGTDTRDWGYSCGLKTDGGPLCWGGENWGYWPRDTVREKHPILFPPEGEFLDIEAGRFRACGLRPTGEVECWGVFEFPYNDNPGRIGSMILNPDPAPGEGFTNVDVGGWHACGLRPTGEVKCWDWTPTHRYKSEGPYEYELEGPYETISSGYRHACGLRRNGGVDCWGYQGHLERLPETPN